jgi:NAD kinase
MGIFLQHGIAIVTRETRMQGLKAKFATVRQAKFYVKQAQKHERMRRSQAAASQSDKASLQSLDEDELTATDTAADFSEYEAEDITYRGGLETLQSELDFGLPLHFVDRAYVPTFNFSFCELVVVVGQDGLVANVAKYVGDLPIVAINPDPQRFDGVLLPFQIPQARRAVGRVLEGKAKSRPITLAEVELNDGQRMLAFNDFFLGASSHISARYLLRLGDREEPQSSSGVLVSTGAGSTGWFSSVFNMVQGVAAWQGGAPIAGEQLRWEDRHLLWAVREPFASKHSRTELVAGSLAEGNELILESLMPEEGVIFSDGMQADALQFNSGTIARVRVAKQRAKLVVS